MARHAGPVCRLCRRIGDKLLLKGDRCLTPKCAVDKRAAKMQRRGPRRRRATEYGIQLKEKQRARYTYGLLERQFRKAFAEAGRQSGVTSENLLVLLERRLDNTVYRLGFATSRAQARQIVRHGHILLNGHRCDIPSCPVKLGDTISWHATSAKNEYYEELTKTIGSQLIPSWLSLNKDTMTGCIAAYPEVAEIDTRYDGKAIVEYYSK